MSSQTENARRPNRLVDETSPYLLQHAYNPVNWYPWGPEALDRAKTEDKPILLSIGYAACHWCHVMEHESFEDPEIAELMNRWFVSIKVDREERPEIDAIYMDAVQAMRGQGGWPMTVFLTPEGLPFYGGTYFPPDDRPGLPSFRRVLEGLANAWRERRDQVEEQGRGLTQHLEILSRPAPSKDELSPSLVEQAARAIAGSFDNTHGGFGGPPKFPQAPLLEFMLRAWDRLWVQKMVELTLEHMARGGIYDQIGGGFHRYSVDPAWLVPHFEKMLYDNAQLARVYTHAWQAAARPLYRRIAAETLDYLLRDMRDARGGFYSSEDADSEGVEGKFYIWRYDEFMAVAPESAAYYGVTEGGNFEEGNILTASTDDPPAEAREKLLRARTDRVRPSRDEKILTSWNGLAIAALAEAGAALGRPDFIAAAETAASFLLENARDEAGRLLHSYKDGKARFLGTLEDYSYLADGLFSLWEATFEPRWFQECLRLSQEMLERFWDSEAGGFFTTGNDHEQLILRQKELVESATPSPNGVAALVLQKLAVVTGSQELAVRGREAVGLARAYMERAPQAVPSFLSGLDFYASPPKEVVILGQPDHPGTKELLAQVWSTFIPNRVLAGAPPGLDSPMLEGKQMRDGSPTAFVCENYACQAPTTDPKELASQLK
jgi:uncharacterized protein YyaL (SSP411 family)